MNFFIGLAITIAILISGLVVITKTDSSKRKTGVPPTSPPSKKWHEKTGSRRALGVLVILTLIVVVLVHQGMNNEKKRIETLEARAEYLKAHPDERLQYVAETTFTRLATVNGQGRLHLPRGRRWDAGPERIGGYRIRYPTDHGDTIVAFPTTATRRDLPYPLTWVEFLALNDTITMVVRIH